MEHKKAAAPAETQILLGFKPRRLPFFGFCVSAFILYKKWKHSLESGSYGPPLQA